MMFVETYSYNNSKAPFKCPVCKGKCKKKLSFYTRNKVDKGLVNCKSCAGKGVIYVNTEKQLIPPLPPLRQRPRPYPWIDQDVTWVTNDNNRMKPMCSMGESDG